MLTCAIAACSSRAEPVGEPGATPSPGPVGGPIGAGPSAVTLVLPGTEPRRIVRYAPAAIARSVRLDFDSAAGRLRTIIELDWSCAAGEPCRYQMTKFTMPGAPADVNADFATFAAGTRGTVWIDPGGRATVEPATLMRTTPSLPDLLRLAIAPVPADAIGPGATWTFADDELRRHYRLDGLTATTMQVELTYEWSQGGATVRGTGRLEIELTDPLPRGLALSQQQTAVTGARLETEISLRDR